MVFPIPFPKSVLALFHWPLKNPVFSLSMTCDGVREFLQGISTSGMWLRVLKSELLHSGAAMSPSRVSEFGVRSKEEPK